MALVPVSLSKVGMSGVTVGATEKDEVSLSARSGWVAKKPCFLYRSVSVKETWTVSVSRIE